MANAQTTAAMRQGLRGLSDGGASFAELLDHLGEENRRLAKSFSDDQEEELELYCWALQKAQSSGVLWGATVPGDREDEIGA